jgi:hypothetical protein
VTALCLATSSTPAPVSEAWDRLKASAALADAIEVLAKLRDRAAQGASLGRAGWYGALIGELARVHHELEEGRA